METTDIKTIKTVQGYSIVLGNFAVGNYLHQCKCGSYFSGSISSRECLECALENYMDKE
jgi:hypothetical protein